MAKFQCNTCGCVDDTAFSFGKSDQDNPWSDIVFKNPYLFKGIAKTMHNCVACRLGGDEHWHNKFPRVFLPKGKFYTNAAGHLADIDTNEVGHEEFILPREETRQEAESRIFSNLWKMPRKSEV